MDSWIKIYISWFPALVVFLAAIAAFAGLGLFCTFWGGSGQALERMAKSNRWYLPMKVNALLLKFLEFVVSDRLSYSRIFPIALFYYFTCQTATIYSAVLRESIGGIKNSHIAFAAYTIWVLPNILCDFYAFNFTRDKIKPLTKALPKLRNVVSSVVCVLLFCLFMSLIQMYFTNVGNNLMEYQAPEDPINPKRAISIGKVFWESFDIRNVWVSFPLYNGTTKVTDWPLLGIIAISSFLPAVVWCFVATFGSILLMVAKLVDRFGKNFEHFGAKECTSILALASGMFIASLTLYAKLTGNW